MRKILTLKWDNRAELESVVYEAVWEVTEEAPNGTVHGTSGTAQFGTPDPDSFIPLSELTEETVLGWLPETFWEPYETYVQGLVDIEMSPNKGEGLPWST